MKKKLIIVASVVLIFVGLYFLGSKVYKQSEANRIGDLSSEDSKLFYPDHAPVYGDINAKVVITEYLDPECESCRMFYPKVKKLIEMYSGKVKLVVRYAPFHANSLHAIKVLEATRKQNKYWESLTLLFDYQPAWADHHAPRPELVFTYLQELGLDIDRLKSDMNDPAIQKIIDHDLVDLEKLQIRGTPTFFVNGKPLESFGLDSLYNATDKAVRLYYQ